MSLKLEELRVGRNLQLQLEQSKLSFSFSKDKRLLNKKDFNFLRKDSTRLRSGFLVFIFKKNERENSRLGLAINRKFGNAIKRNYLKRIAREFFRTTKFSKYNYDVLITVDQSAWSKRSSVKQEQNQKLKNDLQSGLAKISLL